MTTYKLRGLDCPVCAQGLEEGLRRLEGVKAVSVDFGTLSLRIEALDLAAVEAEAAKLEPSIVLERAGRRAGQPATAPAGKAPARVYRLRSELLLFGLAGLAAGGGFLLESALDRGALALPAAFQPLARILPFLLAYLLAGWKVLSGAARNILRGKVFDELFLMSIATIGAFVIGQYEEAVGVMIFYKIGEMLQESAVARSRASVASLLELRPDSARLLRGGAWLLLPAEEALVGEEFIVFPGERLPLDGWVTEGEAFVDTKALTGEPRPRHARPGAELLAGFIAMDGSLRLRSSKPAGESSAARIAELVENASHAKARTERFITRFARIYTPIVVGLASAVAFLPPLLLPGQSLSAWVYRALVMLVISCPCALVVSVPLGYFGGIGGAARRGILVKGGEVLDALAGAASVVFDKTGTLTKGVFKLLEARPEPGFTESELVGLAAAAEARSRHPIAASIREAARERGLSDGSEDEASEVREFAGAGVVATIGGRRVIAGNDRLLHMEGVPHASCESEGTTVNLAIDGRSAGRLLIGDEAKPDAARSIAELKALGVERIAMLTGDEACSARELARSLGIKEVHAGLLPEDKLERLGRIIEESAKRGGRTIFVGDGINDAPVLARADVGMAMGAGADAAVESADLILMTDEPSRVPEAIARARRTRRIVLQNIVFSLGVKAGFLALGALGVAVMWEAVIADVGVALLATLNATRAMK